MQIHYPRPEPVHPKLMLFATRRKNLRINWQGPCIYKVREVLSPYMEEFRGNRILVALPNMEGHKPFTDIPAPSFNRPYLIFQTSDYTNEDLPAMLERLEKELLRRGFSKFEHYQEYTLRMLVRMRLVD